MQQNFDFTSSYNNTSRAGSRSILRRIIFYPRCQLNFKSILSAEYSGRGEILNYIAHRKRTIAKATFFSPAGEDLSSQYLVKIMTCNKIDVFQELRDTRLVNSYWSYKSHTSSRILSTPVNFY